MRRISNYLDAAIVPGQLQDAVMFDSSQSPDATIAVDGGPYDHPHRTALWWYDALRPTAQIDGQSLKLTDGAVQRLADLPLENQWRPSVRRGLARHGRDRRCLWQSRGSQRHAVTGDSCQARFRCSHAHLVAAPFSVLWTTPFCAPMERSSPSALRKMRSVISAS